MVMSAPAPVPAAVNADFSDPRLKTWLAISVWTLLVVLSYGLNARLHEHDIEQQATLVANAYLDKDLAFRRWITRQGGVYVRPSPTTPPNPYLHIPERDVTTTGGQALTLVNPAYATRQMMEDFSSTYGIRGHMTSLHVTNPANAPDELETVALQRFDQGGKEFQVVVDHQGGKALRLIRPLYMEPGCQRCHEDLKLQVGAVRGGIGVTVPLAPFELAAVQWRNGALGTHGALWLVGMVGIGLTTRRDRIRQQERRHAEHIRHQEELRVEALLSLGDKAEALEEGALSREGVEIAVALTSSKVAYLHFVNEDQRTIELGAWSKLALEKCTAFFDSHYPLDKAGLWADCVRMRHPAVHNDYAAEAKARGLPDGHFPVVRHMSVPVIAGGLVRAILGVGNKATPYDADDTRALQLLADDLWKLIQRKRAETRLRSSERLLREAQHVAKMGSWSLDIREGRFEWSEELFSICELSPTAFDTTLSNVLALAHPEDRSRMAEILRNAHPSHGVVEHPCRILLSDGRIKHLRIRGQTLPHPDGTSHRMVGTVVDVSEHAEIEALRRSEADLTALIENTDRIIWSVDTQFRLVTANTVFRDLARRLYGRSIAAGESILLKEMPIDKRIWWKSHLDRALAGEKFIVSHEIDDLEHGKRWMDFAFYPIENEGSIAGVTIFGRDYTEQKQAEAARQETLENMARMMRELEGHHHTATLLARLNDLIQSCRMESEAYDVIHLILAELFPGLSGCLALAEKSHLGFERVAEWGDDHRVSRLFSNEDCWALRRGEVHEVVDNGHGMACQHFDSRPSRGYLCLPLVVRGEMFGLLHLSLPPNADETRRQALREVLRSTGETLKLSLSNLRLREAMREQATHDPLTGLFNRRYLDETLQREIYRSLRTRTPMAMAMIDIDHFKGFNDTLGHEAGDLVLREIGRILRGNLRRSDIACRYGGEELAVIMPDSNARDARARLDEVREMIRTMTLEYRGQTLPSLTVSAGIAEVPNHSEDPKELLHEADIALYAAKNGGRNRTVIYEEGMT